MNLRHKKPINSYRGQANNDKNEFNDDDFKHQPSPSKKLVGSSGEQMYKYSKILSKFIMNANEYYRMRNKGQKRVKNEIQNIVEEAKTTREEIRNPKYQKRLQQPKQKRKIIHKIQSEPLQIKQPKQNSTPKIQPQPVPLPNHVEMEQEKTPPKTLSTKTNVSVNQPTQPKTEPQQPKEPQAYQFQQNVNNLYPQGIQMPGMTGFPNLNLLTAMNGINGMPAINGMNGMTINQYMEFYNKAMEISMYQQMFKNQQLKGMGFPNMRSQMMPGMMTSPADLMNLKQNLYQSYMRGGMVQQPQVVPNVQRNAPIHNLTEVYLTKQESLFNASKQKPNQIVKRANFHVGIAYHIYMKSLQQKGTDMKNTSMIDPTRLSREIKARESSGKRVSRSRTKK